MHDVMTRFDWRHTQRLEHAADGLYRKSWIGLSLTAAFLQVTQSNKGVVVAFLYCQLNFFASLNILLEHPLVFSGEIPSCHCFKDGI